MEPQLNSVMDAIKQAMANPLTAGDLRKAFAVATGLVAYDLEPAAKKTYPVITPLRNRMPRVGGNGDTATRWKAITGINTTNVHPGVSEGQRGAVITTVVADYLAAYVGIGLEDYVTFEATYADDGFDDVKARAVEGLLRSVMIAEERHLWGGNTNVALGTTPTPAGTTAATGGTIADATYKVICVALTHQGYLRSSLSGGVVQQISRTNADASTDTINGGAAQKSAASANVVAGSSNVNTISATVAAVRGAMAYAWYVGVAGSERLEAITTINSVKLTALAGTGQLASALASADYSSQGIYSFNGLIYTALKSDSNAYYLALDTGTAGTGTKLTSNGAAGITEIDAVLKNRWDNYRLSPDEMWMSATDLMDINKLVIANGGAPLYRFNVDATGDVSIMAGKRVGTYLNRITNQIITIGVHPEAVQGTILFVSNSIPYPLSGIGNLMQMKARKEFYQLEWPLRTRKYEYGVYVDEVFQHYFPPSLGVLTNIAAQ